MLHNFIDHDIFQYFSNRSSSFASWRHSNVKTPAAFALAAMLIMALVVAGVDEPGHVAAPNPKSYQLAGDARPILDLSSLLPGYAFAELQQDAFVTTWETTSLSEPLIISTEGKFTIDWGDGMPPANATGLLFHVYATPGNHEVSISGGLKSINLGANPVSAAKLQSIDQWGNITWTNMKNAFEGAENMVYNASDTPDLSGVTDMRLMFYNATSFNGDVSSWNVSSVDDMTDMFKGATSFMQNLGVWYVVPADTAYDATTNTLNVTTISAQNSALNGHSPNYAIGTGGNSTLFNMTGSTLMFKATPSAGDYTVNVTAPEGNFGTNNHHILGITVAGSANSPPTVNAGQDQEVAEGATVTLSGTANDDDLDDTLTYLWTHDGSLAITFADPAALLTTFTAPNVAANTTVTVTLTVNDGTVDISDTLQVNITDSPNNPPEVEAGDDQEVAEGATVTLSGTANDDDLDDTLTYLWTHDGSLAITFADPAALLTTFTAPNVAANTTVTVTLTVNDGTVDISDTLQVNITDSPNNPPEVEAGDDQEVAEGATVTLSGTANDDDLDDTLTYLWTHDGSLAITFADPAALLTTFTAPNVAANTTVTVTLTVNDGTVDISDTLQNITDSPNNPPEVEAGDDQEVAEGATVTRSG